MMDTREREWVVESCLKYVVIDYMMSYLRIPMELEAQNCEENRLD
jgi:hypothetical protein